MQEEKKELSLEELKKKLEECQKLKDEYLAGWQRSRADLLNYKKEEMEKIGEILKYAGEGLILKMLPVLDNFEIAEKKILEDLKSEEDKSSSFPFAAARENDENIKGLLQIKTQMQDFLKSQGVEAIESLGKKFDPNFHEVIKEIELKGKESGTIIEEVQKGYLIQGKILRPAKVRVSK